MRKVTEGPEPTLTAAAVAKMLGPSRDSLPTRPRAAGSTPIGGRLGWEYRFLGARSGLTQLRMQSRRVVATTAS